MRYSNRNAKALAVLSAAAGLAASVQLASAQTWVNPNTGNWSVGTNWVGGVAPVSGTSTVLTFNATGAQTYTATNNIGAFTLAQVVSSNTSTGAINLAGSALQSDGTMLFTKTGTGALNVANALNSISAPNASGGGVATVDGTNANFSGGGTLFAFTSTGNTTASMTGGNWTMTSEARRNDFLVGTNNGPWGMSLGETDGSTTTFTITGANVNGTQGFINCGFGTTGTWNITGGSSVNFAFGPGAAGRFGILTGNGSINVTGGALLSGRLFEVGRHSVDAGSNPVNTSSVVNVTGTNSRILANQLITRAQGTATININSGGLISLTETDATGAGGAGLMGIGGAAQGPTNEPVPQQMSMTIGAGGTFRAIQPQLGSELGVATVNVNGGGQWLQNLSPVASGAAVIGEAIFMGDADALGDVNDTITGFGAINVDGAGSSVNIQSPLGTVIVMGGGGGASSGGDAFMSISNGGNVTANDLTIGQDVDSNGTVVMNGATSTLSIVPNGSGTIGSIVMAGSRTGAQFATGAMTVNGGTVSTGNIFIGGGFADALGDPQPGGNATVNMAAGSRMNVSNQFTMGSVPQGNGAITIAGTVAVAGNSFLSPTDEIGSGSAGTSTSVVNVNGGSFTNAGQLQVGGAGTLEGSSAIINISNNGFVSANGGTSSLIAVFSPGVINIGSGTSKGNVQAGALGTLVDGTINFQAGTFNSVGTLDVGGRVLLSDAGRSGTGTPSNKKMVEAGAATLTASGVIDLNDNDMLLHDTTAGARQKYENFVKAARNNGLWDQPGITSTAAKNASPKNKNLGVLSGTEYLAVNGTPFNGKTVVATDTVIKFTFNGDTDFNGVVNFDDYARVDGGFNNGRSGWLNGDFDYNGIVNFDDYSLIDGAFNTQGSVVLGSQPGGLAGPTDVTLVSTIDGKTYVVGQNADLNHTSQKWVEGNGNLNAVPEPGTLGLAAVAMLGAISRRRRSAR